MPRPLLRMSFADRAALAQEHAENLKHGRAFVKDAQGIEALTDCTLELVHEADGSQLALEAQTVLIVDSGPMRGIGVQLRPFGEEIAARLEAFVSGNAPLPNGDAASDGGASAPAPATAGEVGAAETDAEAAPSLDVDPDSEAAALADEAAAEALAAAAAELAADESDPLAEAEAGADDAAVGVAEGSEAGDDLELPSDQQQQPARHERLRKLSLAQQQKVARQGDLQDRVTLERLFGKQVWESLLHNPKLTVPEVAGMARKGTIPRPLLEFIVENNTWIQAPIVRRALLGNPRTSSEAIMKLLRMTPKHELRGIVKTTTYSTQVREAARKVLEL